jgi:SPP1 gp7 family putative phage head morphogenesis protein
MVAPVAPQPSQIERVSDDYLARLRANEVAARRQLALMYEAAAQSLLPKWKQAYARLQAAKAAGASPEYLSGFIWSEQRLATLLGDVTAILDKLGSDVGVYMSGQLDDAGVLARASVADGIQQGLAIIPRSGSVTLGFASLPQAELELITSRLGDGSPIIESLATRFGQAAVPMMRNELVAAIANGENPAQVARRLARATGAHAGKTAVLFRTEMMRVYRDTQLATMQRNRKYLRGWVWVSALQETTCAMCWAMHGTEHGLDERMETHPACRCSMKGLLRSPGEINPALAGADLDVPKEPTGDKLFRQLTQDQQRRIMGPKLHHAYRQGRIDLSDLPKRTWSPKWGGGRSQRSVAELLGGGQPPPPKPPKPTPTPIPPTAAQGPAGPTKPKGIPVSQHLDASKLPRKGASGAIADKVRETISMIDGVHGDGTLSPVPVQMNQRSASYGVYKSRYAGYVSQGSMTTKADYRRKLVPDAVEVSAKTGNHHTYNTMAHELGHYIDQQYFGRMPGEDFTTTYGSKISGGKLERWRTAVQQTRAVSELKAMQTAPTWGITDASGQVTQHRINRQYIRYAISDEELWARSYAQYIVTKSQHPRALAELREAQDPTKLYHQTQWADDDFAPVLQAIDDIFRDEGWIE